LTQTREHKTYPIVVPGMGALENRTPSTFHPKEIHTAKPSKAGGRKREGRNYRIGGSDRGAYPVLAKETKYVRSGGPARHANRVARNIARQERLRVRGAERRLQQMDRRLDRRILKAAEHMIDVLD
jgi:hypothetical protein